MKLHTDVHLQNPSAKATIALSALWARAGPQD